MKQLMGIVSAALVLCLVFVLFTLSNPYRSVSVKFPSPKQANAVVSLRVKIPKDAELTKAEGDNGMEATLSRDGQVVGRVVFDTVASYAGEETLDTYKMLMNRETEGWSFIRSRQSLNLKQIVSKLANGDSEVGILVQDKKADLYVGIELQKDALTDDQFDVLASSVAIK